MHVRRLASTSIRSGLTIEERWKGADRGLIAAWERGREISEEIGLYSQELTARARRGELVILPWKGGVQHVLKVKQKYGTLRYLAMWQGLRGEDLDIEMDRETEQQCTATGMTVLYTSDATKFAGQESEDGSDGDS